MRASAAPGPASYLVTGQPTSASSTVRVGAAALACAGQLAPGVRSATGVAHVAIAEGTAEGESTGASVEPSSGEFEVPSTIGGPVLSAGPGISPASRSQCFALSSMPEMLTPAAAAYAGA
ncbi:hypothetical protein GPECTOR_3g307 [Gonium pectorale]|uniref:Uncharacterized protein n=1 Tax=Gonium pectorale TaxID=33097 RepID=A0A150GZ82_GONPE|nr:hypothetical protein GPECTOR_3g307 [Gonium pectorale]|eukprot:KXZ55159.1 hypothetical protein GPECTOR_3g307 [Gonium pectorale]